MATRDTLRRGVLRAGALLSISALAACALAQAQPGPTRQRRAQYADASRATDSGLLDPVRRDANAYEGGAVLGRPDASVWPDVATRRRDAAPAVAEVTDAAADAEPARPPVARGGGPTQRPVLGLPPPPSVAPTPPLLGGPDPTPDPPIRVDDAGSSPRAR